jgi:hypothetical protein
MAVFEVPVVVLQMLSKTPPPPDEALLTVTVTAALVFWFPAASRATVVRVWEPFGRAVVSQETMYGAVVSSARRLTPFSLNWTPVTPTLPEALADTVTAEPETVVPAAGAEMETVGGGVFGDEPDARHPM